MEPSLDMLLLMMNVMSTGLKTKLTRLKISKILTKTITWHFSSCIWSYCCLVTNACLQLTLNNLPKFDSIYWCIVKIMIYCLLCLQIVVDLTICWRKILAIMLKALLLTLQMLNLWTYKLHWSIHYLTNHSILLLENFHYKLLLW